MVWYFKKSKNLIILLYIAGIIGTSMIMAIMHADGLIPVIVSVIFCCSWFFITTIISEFYARSLLINVMKKLSDECDIKEYIKIIDGIINTGVKKGHNVTKFLILKSFALFIDEKTDEAWKIIKSITGFTDNALGDMDRITYYSSLFTMYLDSNECNIAEKALQDMKNAIDNSRYLKTSKKSFYELYDDNRMNLEIIKVNKNNYEKIYLQGLGTAKNNLNRVYVKFKLGKLYFDAARYNEAKEAFEYVIQNGNTLHCVQEAKKYLTKIGQVS